MHAITYIYWQIGKLIVEEEQKGAAWSEYGKDALLTEIIL